MRHAIYCTPPLGSPLLHAVEAWFGRSAFGHGITTQPGPFDPASHQRLTASRARYGFHATMVAPFVAAAGVDSGQLAARLESFVASHPPVDVCRLRIRKLDRYLALVPVQQSQALSDLAQALVEAFYDLRAPLSSPELARRDTPDLSPRQRGLLHRWGYPSTEEFFKFHMTLAGPVEEPLLDQAASYLETLLAPHIEEPFLLATLALFCEPVVPGPFHIDTAGHLSGR